MEAWKKRLTQPNLFFSPLRSFRISSVCLTDPETTPFHPSLPPSLHPPPPLRIPTAAQLFLLKSQSSITIRIVEKHRANFRRIDSLQRRGGKHEEGRLSRNRFEGWKVGRKERRQSAWGFASLCFQVNGSRWRVLRWKRNPLSLTLSRPLERDSI